MRTQLAIQEPFAELVEVRVDHPHLDEAAVRAALEGLPQADGYRILVRALRYRTEPRLSALTDFEERSITLHVPEPFHPFGEVVRYGAKRVPGKRMRFVPLSEGVSFRAPGEVLRFLYCHEWYHWFLYEILGRPSHAEVACDRFALRSFRKRAVTIADARNALRRRPA